MRNISASLGNLLAAAALTLSHLSIPQAAAQSPFDILNRQQRVIEGIVRQQRESLGDANRELRQQSQEFELRTTKLGVEDPTPRVYVFTPRPVGINALNHGHLAEIQAVAQGLYVDREQIVVPRVGFSSVSISSITELSFFDQRDQAAAFELSRQLAIRLPELGEIVVRNLSTPSSRDPLSFDLIRRRQFELVSRAR